MILFQPAHQHPDVRSHLLRTIFSQCSHQGVVGQGEEELGRTPQHTAIRPHVPPTTPLLTYAGVSAIARRLTDPSCRLPEAGMGGEGKQQLSGGRSTRRNHLAIRKFPGKAKKKKATPGGPVSVSDSKLGNVKIDAFS